MIVEMKKKDQGQNGNSDNTWWPKMIATHIRVPDISTTDDGIAVF